MRVILNKNENTIREEAKYLKSRKTVDITSNNKLSFKHKRRVIVFSIIHLLLLLSILPMNIEINNVSTGSYLTPFILSPFGSATISK